MAASYLDSFCGLLLNASADGAMLTSVWFPSNEIVTTLKLLQLKSQLLQAAEDLLCGKFHLVETSLRALQQEVPTYSGSALCEMDSLLIVSHEASSGYPVLSLRTQSYMQIFLGCLCLIIQGLCNSSNTFWIMGTLLIFCWIGKLQFYSFVGFEHDRFTLTKNNGLNFPGQTSFLAVCALESFVRDHPLIT